jgi:hypothetical protein
MLDPNLDLTHVHHVIAPIALKELERWQALNLVWPWSSDEGYLRCGDCGSGIHQTHDRHGNRYLITDEELDALCVAHLRNRHEGALPDED